jgi:hypothetical protein
VVAGATQAAGQYQLCIWSSSSGQLQQQVRLLTPITHSRHTSEAGHWCLVFNRMPTVTSVSMLVLPTVDAAHSANYYGLVHLVSVKTTASHKIIVMAQHKRVQRTLMPRSAHATAMLCCYKQMQGVASAAASCCLSWHPVQPFIAVAAEHGGVEVWGCHQGASWTAFAADFVELEVS